VRKRRPPLFRDAKISLKALFISLGERKCKTIEKLMPSKEFSGKETSLGKCPVTEVNNSAFAVGTFPFRIFKCSASRSQAVILHPL